MKKKCLLTAFLVGCSMGMSFAHGMLQETVTNYMLKAKGYENFHVGTIEGYPTFDTMLAKLKVSGVKKVMLMPFMFVAGDHANNNIAGDWKKELEDNGYEVSVLMEGLGQNPDIQDIFIEHARFAAKHKMVDIMDKKSNTLLKKTDGPNVHYLSQSHK